LGIADVWLEPHAAVYTSGGVGRLADDDSSVAAAGEGYGNRTLADNPDPADLVIRCDESSGHH
jgi:hypothetical protein